MRLLALLLALAAAAQGADWNKAALEELAAYVQVQKTTGFLIMQDRQIIYEHNWPLPADAKAFKAAFTHGTDAHGALQEDVASAQKSFVAVLAGIAVDKGLLDVTKPVSAYLGTGWSKSTAEQEQAITALHLLHMNSGLTENMTFEAAAGTKFFYNTPVYALMKPVLEKVSGKKLDAITRTWLTEPLGMNETLWRQRPASFDRAGNPTGLYTTPRDMAKLGQLVLDNGKGVISQKQLAAIFTRSETNPAYGRLWWLNGSTYLIRGAGKRVETMWNPAAPPDMVAAMGAQDRKIYVVPSQRLIVVRTGQTTPDRSFDQRVWQLLKKAAP